MTDPRERRASERFPVNQDTVCDFVSPVVENFGAARIKNISNEGIGVIVSKKVDAGTLLAVNLVNRARTFNKTVIVRVAHVTPAGGGFLIGGTFQTPLTYEELRTMVM
jgi:hypothetical protein